MNTEQQIAAFAAEIVRTEGPILGAKLGYKIKCRFPDVSLKAYGNLKSFIGLFCRDTVTLLGQRGLDDVWGARSGHVAPPLHSTGLISLPSVRFPADSPATMGPLEAQIQMRKSSELSWDPVKVPSPWRAFAQPTAPERVAANLENGEVRCLTNEEPLPAKFVEIPKMTIAETRRIAEDFIPNVSPASHPYLKSILAIDDFWHKWAHEMKTLNAGVHLKPWVAFRHGKIRDLFKERVRAAGAHEDVVQASLESLLRAKTLERRSPILRKQAMPPALRRIAIQAIGTLSDEELRRVWLPLGAVLDALRKG